MKTKFIYGLLALGLTASLSSCSENYLDTVPQSSVSLPTLFNDPDGAQNAINGLGKLMCSQYMSTQGQNGEGTMQLYFGDYPGMALQKCDYTGWMNTINGKYHSNNSNGNMAFSWHYPYRLIANANIIINNIPKEPKEEDKAAWGYIKAQALCYRAHSYLYLVQLYSRRWGYRDGESRGVIIRDDAEYGVDPEYTITPKAASSLKEVYEYIYTDLEEAITLFQASTQNRPSSKRWLPAESVAHAIYARAALTREDWATASAQAKLACKGASLMTAEEYEAGFNTPNNEWIWAAFNSEEQDVYYYSFFAYVGSNSKSSSCRTNPVAISRQLVEKIPANDSRLRIYAIPTEEELPKYPEQVSGSGKVTLTSTANLKKLKAAAEEDPDKNGPAYENALQCNAFYNRIKGDSFYTGRMYSTTTLYYYLCTKFLAQNDLGVGQLCLYRMAEMLYIQAEAEYMLGNEATARQVLESAVAPYQDNYTCTLTGDELLEEILTYREFDLCGEGHSWFDIKRRGASFERKSWLDGGSWNESFAIEGGPNYENDMTFVYPQIETNYNQLVQSTESPTWPN
ncbi:MAG: RagB/SusD family nutrient uptake outer membrane protein [Muribaculaceae bacterium]|nr:RagB/SusD family nutrient uptake outer membrane protein [Muribaculaceae bacterium]